MRDEISNSEIVKFISSIEISNEEGSRASRIPTHTFQSNITKDKELRSHVVEMTRYISIDFEICIREESVCELSIGSFKYKVKLKDLEFASREINCAWTDYGDNSVHFHIVNIETC